MAEALVVSAATGALKPVLGKLVALVSDEYKRLKNIGTEIKTLTRELKAIDAFLENMAEAEDPNPQDKAWMKEVRELSYDVEDNLDDFMARVVADKSAKPDGFMDKIKGALKRVKARHEISKAIEDLKKQVIEVSERNARYRSGEAGASNSGKAPRVDRRAFAIYEDVSKLIGVNKPKKELIQLLAHCDSTKQQTKLVAIVGFGGLGKTTIANVCKSSRYLIVVDDIWKVDDWECIKCALPTTNSGSKIITTTRINDVAESCRSSFGGHIYILRPLSMMQSKQLLYRRLFNSGEKCPSDLAEISDQILGKCAGLPLAIIAISGVLAGKTSKKDQWERVKDSIGRALRNSSIETMVNIISLSYLDLPHNLKTCLLYLSIFPEDHTIDKENLIRRWIGEGFIHKHGGHTLYESGEMCFTKLVNRSLIQPAEIDGTFGGHEVKSCRVHDTVLDFIVSKAVEENFVSTIIDEARFVYPDPLNKVRRLSLQNNGEIPSSLVVSHARSLHVFGPNVKIPSLSEFRLLRVLDIENCEQLEDNDLPGIGNLLHLKYLRLWHTHSVTKLPEELARLHYLEIDIHGYNKVMKIPEIIQKQLVCYVNLVLEDYKELPDEIVDIQGLRVLESVSVYHQSVEFLKAVGRLKNLRKLSIEFKKYLMRWDDNWKEKQEKAVFSIWKLGNASLESLYIDIEEEVSPLGEPVLEEKWFPCPPYGLRELVIKGDSLRTVPKWMKSLVKLEKLLLPMSEMGEEDVEILTALPSLSCLIIKWYKYSDCGPVMEAATRRAMEAHPNRPTLVWTYKL